jgi:hypothetical protein
MDKPNNYPKILLGQRPLTVEELFVNKSRWCQGSDGKNAQNHVVQATDPTAVRWCLGGAMRLVYGHDANLFDKMCRLVTDWLASPGNDPGRNPDYEEDDISLSGWNDEPDRKFTDIRKLVTTLKV